MEKLELKEFYDFGEFRLDAKNRLLWRAGKLVALTPKEFELLLLLVSRGGQVVRKDELLDAVWTDTFVEEGTLTRNVSWLRKKLEAAGNSSEQFIETVPKRGYRFLPPVAVVENPTAVAPLVIEEHRQTHIRVEETVELTNLESEIAIVENASNLPEAQNQNLQLTDGGVNPKSKISNSKSLWLAFAVLAFTTAVFLVYQIYFRRAETKTSIAARVIPFSGALGRENTPAFSPDGKQLAFAWDGGEDGGNLDIYVRLVGAGEPVRLTDTEATEQHPTFSPDGSHIAFVRSFKTHGEVFVIPALGGTERRVARLFSGFASISFAPDGQTLAVIDTEDSTAGKQYAVYLVNLQTGERRRLNRAGDYLGETTPRFSTDGKSVAFLRVFGDRSHDLFVAPAAGGEEPRRITFDKQIIHSLAWSADGERIYFVSFRNSNQTNVWRVSVAGGEPELISTGSKNITNLAVSPDAKRFAFVENKINLDIWRATKNQPPDKKFVATTFNEHSPNFSPDGSRVVFISDRSGKEELWSADADGKNLRQLTDFAGKVGTPRFSPDGAWVVYHARVKENTDIYTVSADGGASRRLTTDASEETLPDWSSDGAWINFSSNRTGENQIWKMAATGGEPMQITRQGGFQAIYDPSGKFVLFKKKNDSGVYRVSVNGGDEEIVPELADANLINSAATPGGIYFLAVNAGKPRKIKFYDFSKENVVDAAENIFPESVTGNLAVSPDGTIFLYARQDQNASSIMLAEIN